MISNVFDVVKKIKKKNMQTSLHFKKKNQIQSNFNSNENEIMMNSND